MRITPTSTSDHLSTVEALPGAPWTDLTCKTESTMAVNTTPENVLSFEDRDHEEQ